MKNPLLLLLLALVTGVTRAEAPADARCELTLLDGEVVWRRDP